MVDSLNGILIGGMLGSSVSSLITGFFNLGPISIEVVEETNISRGGIPPQDDTVTDRYLQFTLRLKDREVKKSFKLSDRKAKLAVKVLNKTEAVKNQISVKVESLKTITKKVIVKVSKS